MSEVEKYPVWGYKVASSRLVEKISDVEMLYYTRLDFPWPMNDRDLVMHTKMAQDPVSKIITLSSTAVPDKVSQNPDCIRIINATTKWTLFPSKSGWMYLEYYLNSDPGGNLPDWLVNMAIDMGPRETIKGIKKLLALPTYKDVKLDYVVE